MAFGENYRPVYDAPMLPNGEYTAQITKAELDHYQQTGNEFVEIHVAIKDHAGCNPSIFTLYEAPTIGQMKANGQPVTQTDVDRANRQITTFFLCFGIKEGDFDLRHWVGKVGRVKIAESYDKNESDKKSKTYKTIYPQKPKDAPSAPAPAQAPAQAQTADPSFDDMTAQDENAKKDIF